ncbi:MAG: hypothetical protein HC796_03710 [Synechococcaceae cyanobacterium RL_1_2]|nr:hypothetical protein [Synechococcaceae cyanobacterium RL_1_2]
MGALIGSGASTPITTDDVGLNLTNVDLTVAIANDGTYTYNLQNASAGLVGIPNLTLAATNISANGDATNTNVNIGTFTLDVNGNAKLSGSALTFSKNAAGIQFSGNNIGAFIGYDKGTPSPNDDLGLLITNANLTIAIAPNGTYNYNLTNANASLIGISSLTLQSSNISANGNATSTNVTIGTFALGIVGSARINGNNLNFTKTATTITLGATNVNAFIGNGANTATTADDVGLAVTNTTFGLTLNQNSTYAYNANGTASLVGINFFNFNGTIAATGDQDKVSVALNNITLNLSQYARLQGNFNFSVFDQNNTEIIEFGMAGVSAFLGQGASTINTADDFGLGLSAVNGKFQIRKPINGIQSLAYDLSGTLAFSGFTGLTLGGTVKAQYNDATFDITINDNGTPTNTADDIILTRGLNRVSGTGLTLGVNALNSVGLQGSISTDAVLDLRNNGDIIAALANVTANISLANQTAGGNLGNTTSQTGTLAGSLENGYLGLVLKNDGRYAFQGFANANVTVNALKAGGDIGVYGVRTNNSSLVINETIQVGNETITINLNTANPNFNLDLGTQLVPIAFDPSGNTFGFNVSNISVDVSLETGVGVNIRGVLDDAATFLSGVKNDLNGTFVAQKLPILDRSIDQIIGVSNYLALGDQVNNYLSTSTDANTSNRSVLGLISYLKDNWLSQLPIYEGLTFVYDPNNSQFILTYASNTTYKTQFDLNLGDQVANLGLEFTGNASIELEVTPTIDFDLVFNWGTNPGVNFNLNNLGFSAAASVSDLVLGAYFGPLEASIGSYDIGKQKGSLNLGFAGGIAYGNFDSDPEKEWQFNITNGGTVDVTLPLYASLAGVEVGTDPANPPTVNLNGSLLVQKTESIDPDGDGPLGLTSLTYVSPGAIALTTANFDKLKNFSNFGVVDVLLMFRGMVSWAKDYRNYEIMETPIPFIDKTLGDALDFATAFNDDVLGKIDFYQPQINLTAGTGATVNQALTTLTASSAFSAQYLDPQTNSNINVVGQYITLDRIGIFQITAVNGNVLTIKQVNDTQDLQLNKVDNVASLVSNGVISNVNYTIHKNGN